MLRALVHEVEFKSEYREMRGVVRRLERRRMRRLRNRVLRALEMRDGRENVRELKARV